MCRLDSNGLPEVRSLLTRHCSSNFIEALTDISITIGALIANGKIVVPDSRELNSNIIEWALEFQSIDYDMAIADEMYDYISTVDQFAEKKAMEHYGSPEESDCKCDEREDFEDLCDLCAENERDWGYAN